MLRVEASNLPNPIKIPRSRRLLPLPPGTRLRTPPAQQQTAAGAVPGSRPTQRSFHGDERWSVKLELGNEDIARLYGQGMAKGAVVWRKGMVEWRPLLITPEFSDILRRTRITVPPSAPSTPETLPPAGLAFDDLTLPRPARLPYEMMPIEPADERRPIATLAPMAADVEAMPAPRSRRPLELGAVALGAFALAWIGHATLSRGPSVDQSSLNAAAMAGPAPASAAAACEPTAASPTPAAAASPSEKSGARPISVGDLPLAAGKSAATPAAHVAAPPPAPAAHVASRAARSAPAAAPAAPAAAPAPVSLPAAPSRSDLMGAMSQVARASSGCGERGGPVRVVVSFASSGVARSIQVSGSDLPAATRSCIIAAASRARVGAFSGDTVTVSKAL